MTADALGQRFTDPLLNAEGLRDGREDKPRIRDRRERHQEDAILEVLYELRGDAKRKPRLSRAARSCKGDEARLVTKQIADSGKLSGAANERARFRREIGVAQAAERRELGDEIEANELEEPLGLLQILETVLAEIAKLKLRAEQGSGRPRDEHLSAVSCSADARSAVHVEAHIAFIGAGRLACVDSHTHAYRASREGALCVVRGRDGFTGLAKGDEECVALRIDLDSVMRSDRAA